jgi:hypothetical protein
MTKRNVPLTKAGKPDKRYVPNTRSKSKTTRRAPSKRTVRRRTKRQIPGYSANPAPSDYQIVAFRPGSRTPHGYWTGRVFDTDPGLAMPHPSRDIAESTAALLSHVIAPGYHVGILKK